jgi:hypothetical protein
MSAYFLRSACVCAAVLSLSFLTGCANYIFKTFDIDQSNESLSLDAKQRIVLVTERGGKKGNRRVVCAEPSPDALSATAASFSGSAAVTIPTAQGAGAGGTGGTGGGAAGGSGGLAGGSSESVASLAMRTQTIQLLRDGYYRLCEAYMNGAIDENQYNVVLTNIGWLMTTLLGIDGIAGTRNVAPVTIGAVAPATKTEAKLESGTPTATAEVSPSTAPASTAPAPTTGNVTPPDAVQSEAIANIVLAVNASTTTPGLCISLLASGDLSWDNPGQRSVLKSCDYLLHGAAHKYVASRAAAPARYNVSPNAAAAQARLCPNGKPAPAC